MRDSIQQAVFDAGASHAIQCHSRGAGELAGIISRYTRLDAACDALESFMGVRPRDDDDLFSVLSIRRGEMADVLALANLDAHSVDATPGIYLAIFESWASPQALETLETEC